MNTGHTEGDLIGEDNPQGLALGDRVYDVLREDILSGKIPVGSTLSEGQLAEQLGVSRTPVRLALRLLLQDDLVESGPRRQLKVRRISPQRRREVFLLRGALEQVAVTEACRTMSIDDIDELRLLLIKQTRAADAQQAGVFIDLDEKFHTGIAAGARLPLLQRFLVQIRAFVRMVGIEAIEQPGRMAAVIREHERILDAIEARDEITAGAAMHAHLASTQATVDEQDQPTDGEGGAEVEVDG